MMRFILFSVILLISIGLRAQSIPITPSIVTFINDSSAVICNDSLSIAIDLDQDSTIDLRIQRSNGLQQCTPMGGPTQSHAEKSLGFTAFDSTVILGRQNLDVFQTVAEEFSIGQTITPANYWIDNRGYFYFDWIRQISPSSCTTFSDGSRVLTPVTHHFLARKTISGNEYHFLFAMRYSRNNDCYQLVMPGTVDIPESELRNFDDQVFITRNRLIVESRSSFNSQSARLYNINGQALRDFRIDHERSEFDVSDLESGVYLLHLEGEGKTYKLFKAE